MPLDLFQRLEDGERRALATASGDLDAEFITTHACGEEAFSLC